MTNVQQGLTLLHSVRFISQTRQRNQFVPFVLHNSTGVPLQFSTLTSLPAKVLFNPTAILQQRTQSSTSMESMQSLSWETVKPGEEMPFDFASGRKLRHQVCEESILYALIQSVLPTFSLSTYYFCLYLPTFFCILPLWLISFNLPLSSTFFHFFSLSPPTLSQFFLNLIILSECMWFACCKANNNNSMSSKCMLYAWSMPYSLHITYLVHLCSLHN